MSTLRPQDFLRQSSLEPQVTVAWSPREGGPATSYDEQHSRALKEPRSILKINSFSTRYSKKNGLDMYGTLKIVVSTRM